MKKTIKLLAFCILISFPSLNALAEVKVLSATPSGKVQGQDATNDIVVVFNQSMMPLEKLPEGDGTGPLKLNPEVKGKYRWTGTNTLTFKPEEKLPLAMGFEATISKGLKSIISGETLENDYTWTFETLRPNLQNSTPYQDSYWVELEDQIYLVFNQSMSPGKAKESIEMTETDEKGNKSKINFIAYTPTPKDMEKNERYNYYMRQSTETIIIIKPESNLKKDCSYSIDLKKGLLAKTGNLGFPEDKQIQFSTYFTFKFIRPASWNRHDPTSGLDFNFTNPVKYSELLKNLEINPKIEFSQYYYENQDFSWGNNQTLLAPMSFNVELKPSTSYWIKISGNLTDKYGQSLGKDVETVIYTSDYESRIYMPNGLGFTERYMKPIRHPITFVNVDEVKLQMALLNINDIIPFIYSNPFSYNRLCTPPGGFTIDRNWDTGVEKNKRILKPIELQEVLGEKQSGIIYLQVDAKGAIDDCRQALLQVTGLGITGKFSPDNNLIYVSYLKTGSPVMDCDVELRDKDNKILWTGKTDKNGFAKTPGWEELDIVPDAYSRPKIWIFVKKGDDFAFSSSDWGTGIYPYAFNISYEYSPEYPKYGGHVFTERGIYRPGETVYIKGIVRERRQGKWELPRINDYALVVQDSRNTDIVKTTVTLSSDFGSFDYKIDLKKDSPTGYYSATLQNINPENEVQKNGRHYHGRREHNFYTTFRVEDYKLATFEVNVKLDEPEYILGDTTTVKMNGWYLFGAPMADMEIEYALRLARDYFEPEGYDGYIFNDNWYDDEGRNYHSQGIIKSGKAKLDSEGNFSFSNPLISRGSYGTLEVIAEGTVTSPDRQRLSGWKKSIVHCGEYYIGLKPVSTFIEKGKDFKVDMITTKPSSEMMEGNEVNCRLVRREWNSVRKAGVGGRLEWITDRKDVVLSTFSFTSGKKPYAWKYTPDKSGLYFFDAKSTDKRGNSIKASTYFYITGKDYCAWERSEDDMIQLICDKKRYKPGESAKIIVKSPYEHAKAVVTLEREGIISHFITDIVGSADTITIPLNQNHLPNVYVCVMLYNGRAGGMKFDEDGLDLGKPSFKIGYTNLVVDPNDKHLFVKTESDKKKYKPGERVNVKLQVNDAKAKGVYAEVMLAVVDLGVLSLINYQTPDSFPFFYGPKPLSVDTSETRIHIIGQRNYGEKGENRGGGGGRELAFDLRTKFIPTAYWNPKILTNSDGSAEVSFVLPDNLTAFRIMATAQTKDCFGAGDSRFSVSKPLLLKPSLPRFALIGDKFSAGVLCHNNTQQDGTVTVQVKAKGIKLVSPDTQQIPIPKGSAKEIKFDFIAENIGQAEFEFRAVMENETDGLKWSLPVKIPRPTEAVATYASTLEEAKEGIKVPSDIYDEASYIDISLAPTAMVGLKGGLEYLFDYPYGCLEQKTSKILPLILSGDFIDIFNLAPLKEHTARELITDYLNQIKEFQTPSGGFCFWKGGNGIPSPYLTSYVLWAVSEARNKGYAVDENVTQGAAGYLRSYLRDDKRNWAWPYSVNADLCTKAFCVYVLSINNISEQGYINDLYKKLDQMPLFGKIYLMKAIKKERMNSAYIEEIKRDLLNKIKVTPTEAHFEESDERGLEWIWSSNTRTTAAILQGLLEVGNDFPMAEKTVRWLTGQRKSGRWVSTQENLYVFYAFDEYVKHYEKENPDFTAQVMLQKKEIMNETFSGRTLKAQNKKLEVKSYEKDTLLPLIFKKTGQGRLYYECRMVYAPKGALPPRAEGISIEKKVESFKSSSIIGDTYGIGSRYMVTLKVKTDQDRHFVVVDDPLPAGFEVVDLSLATESREEARQFSQEKNKNDYDRWWGGFDHWENYDDRVLLFADYLTRGEHTYSYLIQATTPGEFFMPAAKVEEMYTPEVFGRTEQKNISIK